MVFSARITRRHRRPLIDWKESYAILFAFAKWGKHWKGQHFKIMCDNEILVVSINNQFIRSAAIDPLQLIFLATELEDIEICSKWLSSEENWIADALSRFQLDKIANIFPQFPLANWESDIGITGSAVWHGLNHKIRENCNVPLSKYCRYATLRPVLSFPAIFETLA